MGDKLGMPLEEIHVSGDVPKCACFRIVFLIDRNELIRIRNCRQREAAVEHGAVFREAEGGQACVEE